MINISREPLYQKALESQEQAFRIYQRCKDTIRKEITNSEVAKNQDQRPLLFIKIKKLTSPKTEYRIEIEQSNLEKVIESVVQDKVTYCNSLLMDWANFRKPLTNVYEMFSSRIDEIPILFYWNQGLLWKNEESYPRFYMDSTFKTGIQERIEKAVASIMLFNNRFTESCSEKWAINEKNVIALTEAPELPVIYYLARRESLINSHHKRHNIKDYQQEGLTKTLPIISQSQEDQKNLKEINRLKQKYPFLKEISLKAQMTPEEKIRKDIKGLLRHSCHEY